MTLRSLMYTSMRSPRLDQFPTKSDNALGPENRETRQM